MLRLIDNRFLNNLQQKPQKLKLITILLNYVFNAKIYLPLIKASDLFAIADGGANNIYDSAVEEREQYIPKYIVGDLDSLRDDVRSFYKTRGSSIHHLSDQNSNDLQKTIALIMENETFAPQFDYRILVLSALGGRLDQELQSISTLQKNMLSFAQNKLPVTIQILGHNSMATCIPPGLNHYYLAEHYESRLGLGLFPLAQPCRSVRTTGLKWNLGIKERYNYLEFGKFVSSSNESDGSQFIEIENSDALLLTTNLLQDKL